MSVCVCLYIYIWIIIFQNRLKLSGRYHAPLMLNTLVCLLKSKKFSKETMIQLSKSGNLTLMLLLLHLQTLFKFHKLSPPHSPSPSDWSGGSYWDQCWRKDLSLGAVHEFHPPGQSWARPLPCVLHTSFVFQSRIQARITHFILFLCLFSLLLPETVSPPLFAFHGIGIFEECRTIIL